MKVRPVIGLVVIALGAWFLVAVFGSEGNEAEAARSFTSSQQCKGCHAQAWEEWSGSQHSMSWTNPAVRALSNDFANQDCIDCHAPRPVLVTGISERVLPRTSRRSEGVDCIACHMLPAEADGGSRVAGTLSDPRAACRPVETLDLQRPTYCAGCHNQHKTVDQWSESDWPNQGEDCLSCHMPHRNGDPNQGRDHTFLGGNDLAMLQRAVELRGERTGKKWVVELENVGAGHAFPTDERSRAADLFWRPLGGAAGDEPAWRHLYRIRDPYRDEVDVPSTLLHAHQTLEVEIDGQGVEGPIEVALFYKRSPWWKDPEAPDPEREAIEVHRIELQQ